MTDAELLDELTGVEEALRVVVEVVERAELTEEVVFELLELFEVGVAVVEELVPEVAELEVPAVAATELAL
ncbi:MAG TPA: hypothetical protein VLX59_02365 [Acidimicrobiales bacterium]|nr:hypothetical protein [Acidimicrobiales bacterium]